jgi:hypothetical protein
VTGAYPVARADRAWNARGYLLDSLSR